MGTVYAYAKQRVIHRKPIDCSEPMKSTPSPYLSLPADVVPTPHIFGVSGSPRKGGNSDTLLKAILSGAMQHKIDSDRVNLTDVQFQGCIGCEKCRKDKICTGLMDGMAQLYPILLASRGLVLVCPTHNYNVTSWMKAFIDRLYCFYTFANDRPRSWSSQLAGQGRKAVVVAICEQESADDMGFTIEAMTRPLQALGYEIVGELAVLKIFDKGKVKADEEAMANARQLGRLLASGIS